MSLPLHFGGHFGGHFMARLYRRKKTWWLRYYHNGKIFYNNLRTHDYQVALREKAALEHRVALHGAPSRLTFSDAADLYFEDAQTRLNPHSLCLDRARLSRIIKEVGNPKFDSLKPQVIERALRTLCAELSPTTYNYYLTVVRTLSRWLMRRNMAFIDPTQGIIKRTITRADRVWLTRNQVTRLLQLAKDSHHYPMIATGLYAGLRFGELVQLDWEDVDFEQNVIRIRPKPGRWVPKSKRSRIVSLHPILRTTLEGYHRQDGVCFPTPYGRRYLTDTNPYVLRKFFREIGLPGSGLGWHTLRHTFASLAVQAGVPIFKVSQWLGHQDVKTTMIYAHLTTSYDSDISRI